MAFGSIADILYQWEYIGVFDFLLPFLLMFAIVYGILSSTRFFGQNKGVHVVIAFAVGLISLRYQGFLSPFLTELFPRLGIGVAILLTVLILIGMFIAEDQTKYWSWGLAAVGALIAIVVIYQTFGSLGFGFLGNSNSDFVGFVLLGVLLVGVIVAVAASGSDRHHNPEKGKAVLLPWKNWEH